MCAKNVISKIRYIGVKYEYFLRKNIFGLDRINNESRVEKPKKIFQRFYSN